MKAKKVYEFVQSKEIRTDIGINVLQRKSIEEWFAKWAPDNEYTIDDDLNIKTNDLVLPNNKELTWIPDNLSVDGLLSASNTGLLKVPNNLNVRTWFDLRNTDVKELPDDLDQGDIYTNFKI